MRRRLGLVVAVALAARLLAFAINVSHDPPVLELPDSISYVDTAQDFAGVPGIFGDREDRRGERTPVYPAFLLVMFEAKIASPDQLSGAVLVQLLIGACVPALIFLLVHALTGTREATAAGLLAAVEPSGIAFSNVVMTETFYALWLVGIVCCWAALCTRFSTRRLVLLALVCGTAPLVKPIGTYVVVLLLPLLLLPPFRPRLRPWHLGLFLVIALLPATLWSLRNYHAAGTFQLSTTAAWGQALFARDVLRAGGPGARSRLESFDPPPWAQRYGRDRGLSIERINADRRQVFLDVLRERPGAALRLWLRSLVRMAGVPDDLLAKLLLAQPPEYEIGSVSGRLRWLAQLGPLGAYLALGPLISLCGLLAIPWLAVFAARSWTPERRSLIAVTALLVLYNIALGALVAGIGARYRAPVLPLLTALAVVGAGEAVRATAAGRSRGPRRPSPGRR